MAIGPGYRLNMVPLLFSLDPPGDAEDDDELQADADEEMEFFD